MAPGFLRKIFDKVKGIISGDSNDGSKTSLLDKISNGVEAVSKIAEKSEPMIENVQKIIKKTRPKPKPKPKVEIVEEYEEEEPEPLPPPKRRRIAPVTKINQRTFTPYAPVGGSSRENTAYTPDRDNEPYSISKQTSKFSRGPVVQDKNIRPILKSRQIPQYQRDEPPVEQETFDSPEFVSEDDYN
jgi:hypothetical protein